jgi:class 3 adenylate cyclase
MDRARAYLQDHAPRPPIVHLTGARLTQVGSGRASGTLPATPWLQHADSTVDVRIAATELLEFAVLTGVPPESGVRTAALSVSHLRPARLEHAPFVMQARALHSGPNFTLAEVVLEDTLGRAIAHLSGHVLVSPMASAPSPTRYEDRPVAEPSYPTPDPYLRPLTPSVGLGSDEVAQLDGLTVSRRWAAGELPVHPVWGLLGIRLLEPSEGAALLALRASEWLSNPARRVAAGAIACFAHQGLCNSIFTLSPGGRNLGIIDQAVSLFHPVTPDSGEMLCRARVVHQEGDLIHSTAEISDAQGNRVALGHQTSRFVPIRRSAGGAEPERVLATVLFTDIVGSTEHAERLGDAKWRQLLDEHHALVRRQLEVFKGREVKTTGDGFLAAFDSPARAVQCARSVRDGVARLGIEIRAGLHSGECEVVGTDLAGIAVHVASRVQAAAGRGEVLVSSTVRDLVAGSGLRFTDRGRHTLKGLEGHWQLLAVEP